MQATGDARRRGGSKQLGWSNGANCRVVSIQVTPLVMFVPPIHIRDKDGALAGKERFQVKSLGLARSKGAYSER